MSFTIEQAIVSTLRAAKKRDWAMRLVDRTLRPWNPFNPLRYQDPYELYEAVRQSHGPISYQRSLKSWHIFGYAEAEAALRAPMTSVNRTEVLTKITPYTQIKPETRRLFVSTMLMTDPPDHARLRNLVNRAFTPRSVAALEPSIEKIAHQLIEQMALSKNAEVMSEFAHQLPIFVVSDMLGLQQSQWPRLRRLSETLIQFVDPINAFNPAEMDRAVAEFKELVAELVTERVRHPKDDLLTRLIEAEEDGDRLSRPELESMVGLLLVAGHETTSGVLGSSLLALHRHHDARDQLRDDPANATNAVEELLRYDCPVQGTDRMATEDFEIAGHQVRKGQNIGIFLGAANRDPRRYENPNQLWLERPDPRPLSFSHGIHHCLGAALGRLELKIALPLFLQTFPDYEVDEERLRWKQSVTVRSPAKLPMRLS